MNLFIDIDEGVEDDLGFSIEETLGNCVSAVLELEKCPYEVEVSFLLTDDEHIKELNNEFRGIDKSTDVLSFPAIDYEKPSTFDGLEDEYDTYFNPESGDLVLGDIVISKEHVYAQSKEYGHSVLREFAFLIVHSLLHLCGYDHMVQEDAQVMEDRQKLVMDKLGISREVD